MHKLRYLEACGDGAVSCASELAWVGTKDFILGGNSNNVEVGRNVLGASYLASEQPNPRCCLNINQGSGRRQRTKGCVWVVSLFRVQLWGFSPHQYELQEHSTKQWS